ETGRGIGQGSAEVHLRAEAGYCFLPSCFRGWEESVRPEWPEFLRGCFAAHDLGYENRRAAESGSYAVFGQYGRRTLTRWATRHLRSQRGRGDCRSAEKFAQVDCTARVWQQQPILRRREVAHGGSDRSDEHGRV